MSNYEISKSSLLSLKAEILRKQEDVVKAKLENVEKTKTIKKKTPLELKNKGVEERQRSDLDEEEQDLLKLSKSKLEAKARLYDKLSSASCQNEETNKKYLVRFDKKNRDANQPCSDFDPAPDLPVDISDEEKHFSDEYDEDIDPSEEWVEYTDCFGRSRKCLRKDLEYLKLKDAKLMPEKVIPENSINNNFSKSEEVNEEIQNSTITHDLESQISMEESELLSGDMRREMLRQQWEMEEEELRNKTDIHYQNVLFSEARQHGVGYYAFSKDEEERAKQQEALKKLREETEQQQRKAQDLKALRERQMAARMKAARNRRRARLGLPPEENDPTPPETKPEPEDNEKDQEKQKRAEEAEKLLIEARKRHVRPWDIGKEGVNEHYEMTQEEWNEKQRLERTEEFAPPKSYSTREFSGMRSLERDCEEIDKSLKFSTKKTGKNRKSSNNSRREEATDYYGNYSDDDSSDRLLKDYKKSQDLSSSPSTAALRGLNPYKCYNYEPTEPTSDVEDNLNYYKNDEMVKTSVKPIAPTPIINELEEVDFDDRLLDDYTKVMQSTLQEYLSEEENTSRKRGVEIAPPPTFEYYGPGESKCAKSSSAQTNIAESIEAGLKFLRKQASRKGRHCVDDL